MKRLLVLVLALAAGAAHAEAADRDKPIQVDADKGSYNDLKQSSLFTGNVIVTKGTIRVTGERVELRKDPEGYEHATVSGAAGQLARFRQRRDAARPGVEEYVEGHAERIEYDGNAETIKLVHRAQLIRFENGQQRDELRGNLITYDSRTTEYRVDGDPAQGSDGRVRAIIAPRGNPPATGDATPLKAEPAPAKAEPGAPGKGK